MKTNKLKATLLFVIFAVSVSAQNNSTIGFYLNIFKPGEALKASGWKTSAGFSAEYISKSLWNPKKGPLNFYLGGGFDINAGGSKRVDSVVFNTPNNDKGYMSLTNTVVGVWVGPRISFTIPHSGIQPYIDGHIASRSFGNNLNNTFYNIYIYYKIVLILLIFG
jgi:hypothetical protein